MSDQITHDIQKLLKDYYSLLTDAAALLTAIAADHLDLLEGRQEIVSEIATLREKVEAQEAFIYSTFTDTVQGRNNYHAIADMYKAKATALKAKLESMRLMTDDIGRMVDGHDFKVVIHSPTQGDMTVVDESLDV